ncbi:MAG: hypothetical protein ABJM29_07310 [Rhizobiaceae bacterium]
MSHTKPSTITRRSVLAGSAAGLASTALVQSLPGSALAAVPVGKVAPIAADRHAQNLCAAHHAELANHLKSILNASYVDEHMKNKLLTTSRCPHCDVAIAPDQLSRQSFAVL